MVRSATLLLLAASLASAAEIPVDSDYEVARPGGPNANQETPHLGVEMSPPPSQVQEREGLSPNDGVYVQSVFPHSAAQRAGVQPGDVILDVNGTPITSMTDLRNEVGSSTVGQPARVVVQRNGQRLALSDTFGAWPASVPRDPIDPAAERRFRDWQRRRVERQQQELGDLQRAADTLANQLAEDAGRRNDPVAQAKAQEALEERLAREFDALPAFRIDYRVAVDGAGRLPEAADPVVARTVPVREDGQPWRFTWSTHTAPRHQPTGATP